MTVMAQVLVVDDDDTVASVLVSYLQRAGHDAKHVADGLEAVDAVRAGAPDLVVLDLMLPGIDGLEVCRRVRADRPDLPVIMLTALAEPDDRISGLEVGADDYVTKPFSPRELVLRAESILRRAGTDVLGTDGFGIGSGSGGHRRATAAAGRSGHRRPRRAPGVQRTRSSSPSPSANWICSHT